MKDIFYLFAVVLIAVNIYGIILLVLAKKDYQLYIEKQMEAADEMIKNPLKPAAMLDILAFLWQVGGIFTALGGIFISILAINIASSIYLTTGGRADKTFLIALRFVFIGFLMAILYKHFFA